LEVYEKHFDILLESCEVFGPFVPDIKKRIAKMKEPVEAKIQAILKEHGVDT